MDTAFRVLAEQGPELIARQRSDGVLAYVSCASRTLLDHEPGELTGGPLLQLVHPDDVRAVRAAQANVLAGAAPSEQVTARLKRKDGSYASVDVSIFPVAGGGGGASELVMVARDAAPRLAQERAAAATEQRIRALFDAVPGIIYQAVTRPRGDDTAVTFTYVNEWPRRVLGIDPDPAGFADQLGAITRAEDSAIGWARHREAMASGEPWTWRARLTTPNGKLVHLVARAVSERQPDGSVLWSGVMLDDTPRVRATEALEASEEQSRQLVANMAMAHMRFDLDGKLLSVNPASVRLLGYDSEEHLLGKSVLKHLGLPGARFEEIMAGVRDDGVASVELPLRCLDGSLKTVQGSLRMLRDERGRAAAVDGILRDATEDVRVREELIHAREMAEAGSRAKSAFLANMSHEIRTPMNAIIGLSHLALEAHPPPKQQEYLTQIHAAGVALLGILNDILDVSKIEAGKLTLEPEPFEVDRALDALSNVIAMRAVEKGLELVFAVDPAVPDELVGDRMRIGQVLLNLVSNAVKFTDQGEIVVAIEQLWRRERTARFRFSVRDTGIGLSEEQKKRLFQPFSQVDSSSTRRHGGTGLGLTISQELVQMMGGRIDVESEPGRGSEFSFELELGIGRDDLKPEPPAALCKLRVLVVDESSVTRETLTRALLAMGCTVAAVPTAAAALAELATAEQRGAPYTIAFVDARMEDDRGAPLLRQVCDGERLAKPPGLIVTSVKTREEVAATCELPPLRGFLRKPISRVTLHEAIREACQDGHSAARPADVAKERAQPLAGLRLLVVEDNEINQILARDLLEAAGAEVAIASEGREAISLACGAERPFDVILMDVQMPGMDGHATTRVLRTEPRTRTTPIVAMTAHAFEAERKKCLESGMNAHIAKPINPPELLKTVLTWARPTAQVEPQTGEGEPREGRSGPPSFDPTALHGVFRDPARQLTFLRKFVDSARATLASLEPAWQARASAEIGFAGHKLKSSAKACGAHALADVCAALELHAKEGDWSRLEPLRHRAEQLLEDVARAVEALEHAR